MIATKAAAHSRDALSQSERAISDIMWLDYEVQTNGFEGWFYDTPNARMAATLEALELVAFPLVANIARRALAVEGIDPNTLSDVEREAILDNRPDSNYDKLGQFSREYHDGFPDLMEACKAFVVSRQADFDI